MKISNEPLLDKPARGWDRDLPAPHEPPSIKPTPTLLAHPPNYMDAVYLELSRHTFRVRGVGIWLALFLIFLSLSAVDLLLEYVVAARTIETGMAFMLVLAFIMPALTAAYMWRMETAAPRDEPIRFNRDRQKVYIYRFHHDISNFFTRGGWHSRVEVYDWDNLRAEVCSIYGPMGSGGLIEAVTIAVVEPGTTEVIDRFHFAHGGLEGEMYWALAQLYMQQGPQALPKFDRPPRDWNNEKVIFNLARRLAPKVEWPEAMDLESRTTGDSPRVPGGASPSIS